MLFTSVFGLYKIRIYYVGHPGFTVCVIELVYSFVHPLA